MVSLAFILVFFLQVSLLSLPCCAQTHAFQWTFADSSQQISSLLPECQTLKLLLSSSTTNQTALGTPPYYVMAIAANGFTTSSFVGNDPNNLNWQVDHGAGTQLMLAMADANGSPGGMATPLFTVTAGHDTSCLPSPPSTSLVITPNVTMDLSTCEPWGLTVTGGTPPYNVTLISVGSTVVTNVTLPQGFDVFTYINKANPNGQIMAAVSDSTGQFGKTTPVVNTVGSADFICPGQSSQPGKSSVLNTPSTPHRKSVTVVVVCAIIGGLVAVALFVMYMRRRTQIRRGIQDGQDTLPRTFIYQNVHDSPQTALLSTLHSNHSHLKPSLSETMSTLRSGSPSSTSLGYQEIVPYVPIFDDSSRWGHQAETSTVSSHHPYDQLLSSTPSSPYSHSVSTSHTTSYPNPNPVPTSPPSSGADRRYAKLAEAHSLSRDNNIRRGPSPLGSPSSAGGGPASGGLITSPLSSADGRRHIGPNVDSGIEPDIIIQHRDGGVVQELPPPYLDRSRNRSSQNDNASGS